MQSRIRICYGLSFLAALIFFLVSPAIAATFQLSGRVTNQSGSPVAGAEVAVIDPATSTTVTSATSDANGNYAITVDEGTYDIKVTPPTGSGFGESVSPGQVIGGDTNLDFVLVPAGSVTLSGKVLDANGNGVPNQQVQLYGSGISLNDV
ncbi:MAG: carboxypeptidase regulatory-like domain-containing protein, partial [Anaerolineae bacterium]|nr:carboxypeptidase regulatory-like domain-containing protein [Anaerolineae bacterium]